MNVFHYGMLWMAFYGFCIGVIAGGVYDILRIRRIAFAPANRRYGKRTENLPLHTYFSERGRQKTRIGETVLIAFGDFLFLFCLGCAVSILVFYENDGIFRWYALLPCIGGFFLYRNTVGKAVMRCADAIIAKIRQLLHFLVRVALLPLWHLIQTFGRYLYRKATYRYRLFGTKKIFSHLGKTLVPYAIVTESHQKTKENEKKGKRTKRPRTK